MRASIKQEATSTTGREVSLGGETTHQVCVLKDTEATSPAWHYQPGSASLALKVKLCISPPTTLTLRAQQQHRHNNLDLVQPCQQR